ncbi:lytic transglycosylase domain-containing protein [Microbacterium sp. dk485]|uniref:aggregation-promoting factor C-terminal-like domain-containing protein n=1 Tax=Microbacterium sp. dk485 TaxID=2560021 RepID=UPI001ADDA482|nr:lytic transglycosylase domain-containing protein [Microbacterium sp. dk485]
MRSTTSTSSARRTLRHAARRARRRPVLAAGGLALGVFAATVLTGTAPAPKEDTAQAAPSFALASYQVTVQPAEPQEVLDARAALTTAETALAEAATVTNDIAASGVDIGEPAPTVDTAALESAAQRLTDAQALPIPLLPHVTDEVTLHAATVDTRVDQLRGSLDGALARKAEAEAAEKARVEAEAAAAAAAEEAAAAQPAAASSAALPAAPLPAGGGSGDNSPAGAQATARGMLGGFGWGDDQFGCLVSLWQKESGWNYQAQNRSSGAYGIPQALPGSKMASAGADWATNAGTQVAWGLGYISGRYGSPCGAWSHSQSVGWY